MVMRRSCSLPAILASMTILALFGSAEASGEDPRLAGEAGSNLLVMAAPGYPGEPSSVDEYINRSKSEGTLIALYPSNPQESRGLWLGGDGGETNDSAYLDLMELVRIQYLEDLNYSSYILDEFVKKRIDRREAMTSTMTLFQLTSQTVDMVDLSAPPDRFREYHNNSEQALIHLEGYLWNMVKFYETNRRVYAMQAHDNFNKSMAHYENWVVLSKQIN